MSLDEIFDKHAAEFLQFARIDNKTSQRPDLHAFNLLDKLCPDNVDMLSCAEHDEVLLSVSAEELTAAATEDQLVELHRCGVRYNPDTDSLSMLV